MAKIHFFKGLFVNTTHFFKGDFVYVSDSVQVVLFRIGAKIVIFCKLSAQPAPIIPVFRNGLSRFSARVLHPRQCLHQLGAGQKRLKNFVLSNTTMARLKIMLIFAD